MSGCGSLGVVVLAVEIEGGAAESVGAFDVGPARRRRRGSWGVSKGGAWFYGQVRLRGFGDSVAPESTRHVTAFCHSRLGNPRCYCTAQKRKVTVSELIMLNLNCSTRRGCFKIQS